jgi:hypothetical protein
MLGNPLKAGLWATLEGATPEENAKMLIEGVMFFAYKNMHLIRPFLAKLAKSDPPQKDLAEYFKKISREYVGSLLNAILDADTTIPEEEKDTMTDIEIKSAGEPYPDQHEVCFGKSDYTHTEQLTTSELKDLLAACELRLAEKIPSLVIRLRLPVDGDIDFSDYLRMSASASQIAGIALDFASMPDVFPVVQQSLIDRAISHGPDYEHKVTDSQRVSGIRFARSLHPGMMKELAELFVSFAIENIGNDDEAADQAG